MYIYILYIYIILSDMISQKINNADDFKKILIRLNLKILQIELT